MTNTHHHHFTLKYSAIASLLIGILSIMGTTSRFYLAQLSGGGALTVRAPQPTEVATFMPLYGAATEPVSDAATQLQLIFGMFFILLGFTIYLLYVQKMRTTPITVRLLYPRHSKFKALRKWLQNGLDAPFRI